MKLKAVGLRKTKTRGARWHGAGSRSGAVSSFGEHRTTVQTPVISKTAEVTVFFWIMKVLATTLGETVGDFVSMTLGLGYYEGLAITSAVLIVILVLQIGAKRFHPLLFWAAIIATTTVGTEISDFMDRSLGLGYLAGSIILLSGLLLTLAIWYYQEVDVRIYPIVRRDVEVFFWIAVLFSNSLGTAFGDFLTDDAGLTFVQGALVTGGVIAIVLALHYVTRLDDVLLFWIAFIFTRPFGATFGDLLTKLLHKVDEFAQRLGVIDYVVPAARNSKHIEVGSR